VLLQLLLLCRRRRRLRLLQGLDLVRERAGSHPTVVHGRCPPHLGGAPPSRGGGGVPTAVAAAAAAVAAVPTAGTTTASYTAAAIPAALHDGHVLRDLRPVVAVHLKRLHEVLVGLRPRARARQRQALEWGGHRYLRG
jgi:hypothetical protein